MALRFPSAVSFMRRSFFGRCGRPRPSRTAPPYDIAALHRKYAKYKKIDSLTASFVGLPMAVLAVWGFVEAMATLSYWYWRPEGTVLARTMNSGIWIVPAIFYAIPIVLARVAFFWRLVSPGLRPVDGLLRTDLRYQPASRR